MSSDLVRALGDFLELQNEYYLKFCRFFFFYKKFVDQVNKADFLQIFSGEGNIYCHFCE